jgi:hypothetical protein
MGEHSNECSPHGIGIHDKLYENKHEMVVIVKQIGTFFFKELGPFPRESTLFPREGVFFLKEFGPFLMENSLLLGEVIFSCRKHFLLHGELAWD